MKIIRFLLIGLILYSSYFYFSDDGKRFFSRFFITNPNLRQIEVTESIGKIQKLEADQKTKYLITKNDVILENEIISSDESSIISIKLNKKENFNLVLGEKSILKFNNILNKSPNDPSIKIFSIELIKGQLFVQHNSNKNLSIKVKLRNNLFTLDKGEYFFMNDIEKNLLALNLKGTISVTIPDRPELKLFGENEFFSNKNIPYYKQEKSELLTIVKTPPPVLKSFHDFGLTQEYLTNYTKKITETKNKENFNNSTLNDVSLIIQQLDDKYKVLSDDLTKTRNDYVELKNEIEENKDNLNLDILCIESKMNNCQIKCTKLFEKLNLKVPTNPNDNIDTLANTLKVYRSDSIIKLENIQKDIDAKTARNDQSLNQLEMLKLKFQTLKQNPDNKELYTEIVNQSKEK